MNIEDLKKQILAANKAYRDGYPTMDDQTFDDLCEELEKAISNEEYAAFRDSLNEGKGKVKHPFVMGSLSKLKYEEPDEVIKFVKSLGSKLNVSAKIDGISSRATYIKGKLISLVSRGDGYFGEPLTGKMAYIKNLPHELIDTVEHKLVDDENFEIRGELVILDEDFEKLNNEFNGKFSNARNACAGIMNKKDWTPSEIKYVSFVPYTILGNDYSKHEQFWVLNHIEGMHPAWSIEVDINSISNIPQQLFEWASQDLPYATDGLVICSPDYRNEDRYKPLQMMAFKINQQIATTRLIDIEWSGPSKDGFFVGVGILDPVELGGAQISRVSLHNLDMIDSLGLMYGSKVQIKRSGDVIPYVEAVLENDASCSKIELPTECPCCGSKLVRDGINMRCINHDCPEQVVHRLVGFIKKLGVKSASNATLMNFGITSFDKLLDFSPDKKYKSEVKLYDELYAKVFSQSKEKLLGAMNFVGLSETLIGKIVSHYGIDVIESDSFSSTAKACPLPNGIGMLTLDAFIEGLPEALSNMHKVIEDTRWHYTGSILGASSRQMAVKGSICVTGSLNFGSRDMFLEFAKAHGYESKSGVSKGLTYLINNDINSNSSKNRKAKELGIKILTENDFMKLVNDNSLECSLDSL